MARRAKASDYTVSVIYETDPEEVSKNLTRELLKIYQSMNAEQRKELKQKSKEKL